MSPNEQWLRYIVMGFATPSPTLTTRCTSYLYLGLYLSMSISVQDRRRRGQSHFFTPVAESPEASSSIKPSTRRKNKVHTNSGERERTPTGPRISRSSSSPLIYHGEQVPLYRLQPMSTMSHQGSSGATEMPLNSATRSAHSHSHIAPSRLSTSHQHLAFYSSQLQPTPGQRHSLAQSQPHFHTESPYSGSDADEDDNETLDERPLLVRSRSGSGNITSRRLSRHPNLILPFSPTNGPQVMARHAIETEADIDTSRPKPAMIPNGNVSALSDSGNGHKEFSKNNLANHPIIIRISGSSIQFSVNMDRISPLLFQCLCTLAAIPAATETFALLMHMCYPRPNAGGNTRLDYIAAAAWSILTAHQCFAFTTGLLTRWRHYYPLPSTLIRLVALQGICWPATFYTLRLLQYDGIERPLVCWSVIGTTTCITRSIQMWVTSNIDYWTRDHDGATQYGAHTVASIALGFGEKKVLGGGNETEREDAAKRRQLLVPSSRTPSHSDGLSKKFRKWDWNEVVWKCAFPAGICYFFTAWVLLLSREMYPRLSCDSG